MRVSIHRVSRKEQEQVIIECTEVNAQVQDIKAYAEAKGEELTGYVMEETLYEEKRRMERFTLDAVLYFEAVDEHVFAYTTQKEYELKRRLYEIEEQYKKKDFVRCSKSVVLNLMQLGSISPALNGRFYAHMKNGEKLMISRQYAPVIRKIVAGGER